MSDKEVVTASNEGEQSKSTADTSNLCAIGEILSYIQVDAVKDGFPEVAARIDFAMTAVEKALKSHSGSQKPADVDDEPGEDSEGQAYSEGGYSRPAASARPTR